jgi:4-aminobutyrate aminotransferase
MMSRPESEGDANVTAAALDFRNGRVKMRSSALLDRDAKVFVHQTLSTPCIDAVAESSGCRITTIDGKSILDFHGNAVHQVGYGNEYVIARINEAMGKLPFSPRRYTNEYAVELAEKLTTLAGGGISRALFAPAATLSVGMAIKAVRYATGKHRILSMWDSFHGASLDAVSVGGEALFRKGVGPLLEGVDHFPPVMTYEPLWGKTESYLGNLLSYIEYMITTQGDVGAVLLETVRNTDVQVPPLSFMKNLRAVCDRTGTKLILDETAIALGRTGRFFAYEHYGIVPDAVIIGKGLGGGIFPISAVLLTEELSRVGESSIGHFTHEKSPVGCAAALGTIEYIECENLVSRSAAFGETMRSLMKGLAVTHAVIGDTRSIGLLGGMEFSRNALKRYGTDLCERIMYRSIELGLSFKVSHGKTIQLVPPLVISETELADAFTMLDSAINSVTK